MLHPLPAGFRIEELSGPAALDPDLEAEVEAVWQSAVTESDGKLFNGVLFTLAGRGPEAARLERSEYRRYIAGRRRPPLAERLALRPVGVTGFTTCSDGVVMGRRAARLELGGLWEPAPAGTLDRLDARALVLQEVEEELGFGPDRVAGAELRWLYEDDHGVDLVFAVELEASADAVRAAWEARATDEYADVAVVPWVAFRASAKRDDFTPLARALAAA